MSRLASLAVFDSKGAAFWSQFWLFSKICNPTIPCARVHKLLFQVNFANWDRDSTFLHLPTLVLLDFLRFVMSIIIAVEVNGNGMTWLLYMVQEV